MSKIYKEDFEVIDRTYQNIVHEMERVIDMFGGDLFEYISRTENPFNFNVEIDDAMKYIDANYLELAGNVEKIFNNTVVMESIVDDFDKYVNIVNSLKESGYESKEDKTRVMAVVMIFIRKNSRCPVIKKIQLILKSMCIQPTVGTLVQVTSHVLYND